MFGLSKKHIAKGIAALCVGLLAIPFAVYFARPDIFSLILSPKTRRGARFSGRAASAGKAKRLKQRKRQSRFSLEIRNTIDRYGNLPFIVKDFSLVDIGDVDDGYIPEFREISIPAVPIPDSVRGLVGLDTLRTAVPKPDGDSGRRRGISLGPKPTPVVKRVWTYIDRMRAADALDSNLSAAERTALLRFLHKKTSEDALAPIDLNAVKNQVAVALLRQTPPVKEFPLHLIAMYYGRLDKTWRDYCVQFLGQCYDLIGDPETKVLVRRTLFDAAKDRKDIAGSAIVALDGLVGRPGFKSSDVAETAYRLAADPETADIVKIPALQIAVKHRHPKAVELAASILRRSLAPAAGEPRESKIEKLGKSRTPELENSRTSHPSVILRMSAIAALGIARDHGHAALVERFRHSSDIRLRMAAKAALAEL